MKNITLGYGTFCSNYPSHLFANTILSSSITGSFQRFQPHTTNIQFLVFRPHPLERQLQFKNGSHLNFSILAFSLTQFALMFLFI